MKKASICIVSMFSILSIAVLFQNCGSSGRGGSVNSGGAALAVNGIDMSGTWQASRIECYNSNRTVMTNYANVIGINPTILKINGNSAIETMSSNNCTFGISSSIAFQNTTMSIDNITVQSATNGSCTLTRTLSNSVVLPNSLSETHATGDSLGSKDNVGFINIPNLATPAFGMLTIFTDGTLGGSCYQIFNKQ